MSFLSSLFDGFRRPESEGAVADGEGRLSRAEMAWLVVTVLVARVLAARAFPIYDDAFITYRYARNFASGLGMVFNPGAAWEPVLGTTTPGYTALLAALTWTGLPMIATSLAINFLCDAGSAWLLIRMFDRRRVSSLAAVLAFAAIPEIARVSAGGMEPPLVVATSLAAVFLFQRGRMVASGMASAFACTLRPECVLLVLVLAVLCVVQRRSLLAYTIPIAIVGVVTAGTLQWFYGSPISHSVMAKAAVHGGEQKPGFSRVPDILAQALGPSQPMRLFSVVVAIGGVAMLLRRSRLAPFGLFAAGIVCAYLIVQPKTWGWYFYAPLFAWTAALGLGFEQIARWIGFARLGLDRPAVMRAAVVAGPLFVLAAVSAFPMLREDRITPRIYRQFESWAAEERLAERGVTISASDIGALGWYTNARILDSEGLVWPEALELTRTVDQIEKYLPDYVVLVVRKSRLKPFLVDSPALAARYRPVRRFNEFSPAGSDKLTPSIAELPDWWEQDYLIFERIDPPTSAGGK